MVVHVASYIRPLPAWVNVDDLVYSLALIRRILTITVVLGLFVPHSFVKQYITRKNGKPIRAQDAPSYRFQILASGHIKWDPSPRKSHFHPQVSDLLLRSLHIDWYFIAKMFESLLYLVGFAFVGQGEAIRALISSSIGQEAVPIAKDFTSFSIEYSILPDYAGTPLSRFRRCFPHHL